jgi:hypothetical protein
MNNSITHEFKSQADYEMTHGKVKIINTKLLNKDIIGWLNETSEINTTEQRTQNDSNFNKKKQQK